ncbi:MAG TPA: hypothetical protein VNJ04_03280 [Gemmatimonadaceae bacterium]|nr:hypothetical protein [Gemmatimonadaceae bacterium]
MSQQTVQRIVWGAAYTGLVVDVAAIVIAVSVWSGLSVSGAFSTAAATAVMIATLALQLTFVTVQMFPNGRAVVPVPNLGPDGWFWVILSTAIPGVLWHTLADLAIPGMRLIMPGFATPLLTCLLLLVGRRMQLRRRAEARA